ncbi:MAG: VOC family protein [Planctomycetota bacterium]
MEYLEIEHVQLAMPPGQEAVARDFYTEVLGLTEVSKPAVLQARGGAWFEAGSVRLHLGVQGDFVAAKKAHPALLVQGLDELEQRCVKAGVAVTAADPIAGFRRFHIHDPFGNRIEMMEHIS